MTMLTYFIVNSFKQFKLIHLENMHGNAKSIMCISLAQVLACPGNFFPHLVTLNFA